MKQSATRRQQLGVSTQQSAPRKREWGLEKLETRRKGVNGGFVYIEGKKMPPFLRVSKVFR
jgi:hypothetical protein